MNELLNVLKTVRVNWLGLAVYLLFSTVWGFLIIAVPEGNALLFAHMMFGIVLVIVALALRVFYFED